MSLFDSSFRAATMVVSSHRYGLANKRNDDDDDSAFGERIEVDYDTESGSEGESYGSGPRSFISAKSSNGESMVLNDTDSSALDLTASLEMERKSPASPLFKSLLNTSPQHYNPKSDPNNSSTASLGAIAVQTIIPQNDEEDILKATTRTIEDEDYACFRLLGLYKHQVTPHDLLVKLFDIFGSTDYTDNTVETKKKLTFRSAAIAVTMSAMFKSKQAPTEANSEHRHTKQQAINNLHKKIRDSINGKTGDDKGSPQYLEKIRKRIGYVPKKHMKMMMKEQEKKEVKKDNNIEDETFNKYKILQNQHQKQKNKYSNIKKRIKYLKFKNIMLESTIYMKDKNNSLESILGYSTKVVYENPFIDFNTCLNHITTLAKLRFPEMEKNSLEMCSTSLLYPYVLNMMKRALKLVNNFSKWITDDPNISSLFHYYRPPLLRIFNLFIKKENELKQTEAVDIFKTNNTMNIDAFLSFCNAFSITPNMIPDTVAKKIFINIIKEKHNSFLSKKSSNSIRTVSIGEFLEILARLASNFSIQFEDMLKQCQYLLDHLEEHYYLLFGEFMSKERKRSYLTKNQPDNNLNITKSSFDEATILRKKSISVNSSVDFYQNSNNVEEKKIPSILRSVNMTKVVKKPLKMDFIKSEQDLKEYIGDDRFNMMDVSRTLHKVFSLYCKDKHGSWTCKDFLNFLKDFELDKRIMKFQQFLSLKYDDEELFDDLGLPEVDDKYLSAQFKSKSFENSLSKVKLYALFHDIYEEKVKSLSSRDTFSMFLDRVFSKSNYLKAVEKVRERNLHKMKDPNNESLVNTSSSLNTATSMSLHLSSSLISIERARPSTSTSSSMVSLPETRLFFTNRVFRQFNLLKGCKVVAFAENRKGCVMKTDHGIVPTSFDLNMSITDKFVERELLSHLTVCETFNQFIDRLIMLGYDVQSKCGDQYNQGNIKCLRFCKRKTMDPVGCIFDMKGQFSSLQYQPTLGDLIRTDCGLTLYELDSNILFNSLLTLFKECICIDELSHSIRDLGFDIVNVKFC